MVRRPPSGTVRAGRTERTFQKRYDELEEHRKALIGKLAALGEAAHAHPSYKRVQTLLNPTFRRASIAQRAAILKAATWLINLIDVSVPML